MDTIDITLDDVVSTNATLVGPCGQQGFEILDVTSGDMSVSSLTIDGPGGEGLSIEGSGATFTFDNVDIQGTNTDGIIVGVVSDVTGTVNIDGGIINSTGSSGVRVGSAVNGSGASDFNFNDTTVSNNSTFTIQLANSTVGGSGNTAPSFGCNDGGGNTGSILFNAGADSCP